MDTTIFGAEDNNWSTTSLLRSFHSSLGKPVEAVPIPEEKIEELCWNARYEIRTLLGRGGQGVVYLARREGVDGYHTNVALKLFHRASDMTLESYLEEMRRIASQAQRISQIQHDNIISVRDFVSIDETRVMVAEWVDGLDLAKLLDLRRLGMLRERIPEKFREHMDQVIVTEGEDHCRLKPGIAVDILRGCLAGLSSLHHSGIAHCDLKPSNIMIKRSGTKKIIDMDSSCLIQNDQPQLRGTPYYMSPEQHRAQPVRLRSDVASLGYILIEMVTGKLLFRDAKTMQQLLEEKVRLPSRLDSILPDEVRDDRILNGMINKMIAVDPEDRFADADAADLDRVGAVSFHRHLVKIDLDTEYDRELAWWLELLNSHDLYRD